MVHISITSTSHKVPLRLCSIYVGVIMLAMRVRGSIIFKLSSSH